MVSLRRIIVLAMAAALPLGMQTPVRSQSALQVPPPQILAQAGDARSRVKTQANTALTHARLAAGANDVNRVWEHLGHVFNCIHGPQGDVCQGQGNGILKDLGSLGASSRPGELGLETVARVTADLAGAGSGLKDVPNARTVARGVEALLVMFVREFR